MIRLPPGAPLAPAEQFGLRVLVDCSRLLPVDDPGADVVRLVVDDAGPGSLQDFFAGGLLPRLADGEIVIRRSDLLHVATLAGGVPEQRTTAADRHGRVPSSENPLVAWKRFRDPVVSHAAIALRTAAMQAAGSRALRLVPAWPEGRRWAAALTHDLDLVSAWPLYTAMRIAELGARLEVRQAAAVMMAGAISVGRSPVWRAARELLQLERTAGMPATWFVICGTPTVGSFRRGDVTYRPESALARRIIHAAREAGHELALHGSFDSMTDVDEMRRQRDRLARLAGSPPAGVRQHFLRMRPGRTQRVQAGAGFGYDASFGFSDRNGFRLGVADVVPAWDVDAGAELPLDLVPLTWMDRALSKYAGVDDPERWVDDALSLARTCRDAGGLWVGLWHPNLTAALGFPRAEVALQRLLQSLVADDPFVATLERLVAWRRARRSLRARKVSEGGTVHCTADHPWGGRLFLEGEHGRAFEVGPWPEAPPG